MKELTDLLSAHDSISKMIEKCVSIMQVMLQEIPIDDEIEAVEDDVDCEAHEVDGNVEEDNKVVNE